MSSEHELFLDEIQDAIQEDEETFDLWWELKEMWGKSLPSGHKMLEWETIQLKEVQEFRDAPPRVQELLGESARMYTRVYGVVQKVSNHIWPGGF